MESRTFSATLATVGKSVGVPLPFDPNEIWGARERHDVSGTIAGHPVRGPLQLWGDGRYYLALGPTWRKHSEIDFSAAVDVTIRPEGPQSDNMPQDFVDALAANETARAFFESIAPFYRKNFLRAIESAKRPETRARRIAETIALLEAGQRQ